MSAKKESFRDRLLDSESLSPESRAAFEREITTIVRPKLTRGGRWYYAAFLIGLMCVAVNSVVLAIVFRNNAAVAVVNLLVGVSCLVAAVPVFLVLRRGAENFAIQQAFGKALPGVALAATCGLLVYAGYEIDSAPLLWPAFGLLFFLMTSFINLYNRTIAAERTMREHLLRLEYRVVELAERLEK